MELHSPPPSPTGDIATPRDVEELVRRFYADVSQDELLGPLFNEVAKVDWSEHLPKLAKFWCRALFDIEGYQGNPFRQHALVHQKRPFTEAHFARWLELFHETIDVGWHGVNAERAKELARNVAQVHRRQLQRTTIDLISPDQPHWLS